MQEVSVSEKLLQRPGEGVQRGADQVADAESGAAGKDAALEEKILSASR